LFDDKYATKEVLSFCSMVLPIELLLGFYSTELNLNKLNS